MYELIVEKYKVNLFLAHDPGTVSIKTHALSLGKKGFDLDLQISHI